MKKIILILLVLIGFVAINGSFAQIDDIKKKSRENKSDKPSFSEGGGFSSGSDDPCLGACGEFCFEIFFAVLFEELAEHHTYLMQNLESDPTPLSLEIKPHFSYGPDDGFVNYLPGIRGTLGTISTDFRLNYLSEYEDYTAEMFKVYEWQFMLNLTPVKEFNIRIGTGLYFESFTDSVTDPVTLEKSNEKFKDTFNEHFVGLSLRLNDLDIISTLEGRFAMDYDTQEQVFTEINFRVEKRFINFPHLYGYFHGGFIYQRYYSAVNLWSVQTGFTFNIH